MRIGISIKWTVSAVAVVILVVCVYAIFTIRDAQQSVARETERIQRIQYEALDGLGKQTTLSISQPASGLIYDNDRKGLTELINPLVQGSGDQEYSAVYAAIIAPNGRVWTTTINGEFSQFEMADTVVFDRDREQQVIAEIDKDWLQTHIISHEMPNHEDVEHTLTDSSGHKRQLKIRQYANEIKSKTDELQGYLLIGYGMDGMDEEIKAIQEQGEKRQSETLRRSLWLAIVAVIIGLITGILQSLLVTRNIKKLSKAADQIASGDLTVRCDIHSGDEIGQLGDQFNLMADRVKALLVETEQKAALEKEVDIARTIQATLLPPVGYARCGRMEIEGFFEPATQCGGDYWSYHLLPDGSTLITIGDVTGHGVPSAMITACAKSALDTLLNVVAHGITLSQIVGFLNVAICQAAKRTLFMTFQAIRISADGRVCEIVNAGHNFPLLIRQNEVKALVVRGERLGDNPNAQYQSIVAELYPGDMFFLYTDGLTEYQNASGAEYGEKRLRKVIADFGRTSVADAMKLLQNDFRGFCGTAPQQDDITLMFARVM